MSTFSAEEAIAYANGYSIGVALSEGARRIELGQMRRIGEIFARGVSVPPRMVAKLRGLRDGMNRTLTTDPNAEVCTCVSTADMILPQETAEAFVEG